MRQESNTFRSLDDSALHKGEIKRTDKSKDPLEYLSLERRHTIFKPYSDSQKIDARPESEEHQDLTKTVEKNLKDMHSLRQDHKLANAYYDIHNINPNRRANDKYDQFAQGYNTRREKFADRLDTVNTAIEKYNAARPNEKPVPKLDLPPKLKLIKTSPDSGSSSPDKSDMNSDRSEKADHYAEISSKKQQKSANNRALKKFMQFATAATYHAIMSRLDVATALPTSGYHRSWNDTSNNMGNISRRQQLFNGTDFNNTAFLLQEVQSDPQFAWNAFQNKDFVNKALDNQGLVNFITNKGAVAGTALAIAAGGALLGALANHYFARRARLRQQALFDNQQALFHNQYELQRIQNVQGQNVAGFNAAVNQAGAAGAAGVAAAYAGINLNP